MLTSIQAAGVMPEVNPRNLLQVRKHARDPPWLWNPGQTSQENQNRDISGLEKGAYVLRLKKKYIATWGDKNIEPLVCGQYGYLTVVFKMAVQRSSKYNRYQ